MGPIRTRVSGGGGGGGGGREGVGGEEDGNSEFSFHLTMIFLPLFIYFIFKQCNTILWKGHNNERQDQKESFTII